MEFYITKKTFSDAVLYAMEDTVFYSEDKEEKEEFRKKIEENELLLERYSDFLLGHLDIFVLDEE